MWEKLKSIIKDFLVKIKVFFPNRNPILPEQDINNDANTKFIENGINHFRIRNYLLKYNITKISIVILYLLINCYLRNWKWSLFLRNNQRHW